MKKQLLALLFIPFLLISCNNKKAPSESSESPSDSSEPITEESSSESETESETETEETSTDTSTSEEPPAGKFYSYDGYYDENLSWDDGEDLLNKLHNIISSGYTSLKYDGNWETNQKADQDLYDLEMVNLLYSDENDLKTNTYSNGKGWQREHAFAASLMTGFTSGDAVGVGSGRATDFHNLFAASYSGNTSRGNKNFGIADLNAEDGSYQDKGSYTFDSKNFEPSDFDKGKVSRAIIYMTAMYNQTEEATVKTKLNYNDADKATYGQASVTISVPVAYQPLTLKEEYVPYSKVTYTNWYYKNDIYGEDEEGQQVLITDVSALVDEYGEGVDGYAKYSMANCEFAIGNKSTIVDWGLSKEVDLIEMQHNNYVYSVQHNRNPFIDFPELIDYVYGEKANTPGTLKNLNASYYSLNMDKEGASHYAIETAVREFDVNSTLTNEDYKIISINHDLSKGSAYTSDFTYTFTDEDATNGTKLIEIDTPINKVKYNVKVNSGSFNSCSYQYEIIGSAASTAGSEFVNYTSGKVVNLGGTNWTFTWTNPNGLVGSKDKTYGLIFGKNASSRVNKLTIETVDSYNVNALYLKAATAAGQTANYKMYVGETLIASGTFTRESAPTILGDGFESLTGSLRIVIDGSGAESGAIYIHSLAYNIA